MAVYNKSRRYVNVVSFLITCFVLFVAVSLSDGSFANRINEITKNLDQQLGEAIQNKTVDFVNVTNNDGNYTFDIGSQFHPRGMAGLYNLTIKFMNLILTDINPDDFLLAKRNHIEIKYATIQEVIPKYAGILALSIVLALMLALFPLCGFFFCCCRCCGNCGAKPLPCDKKGDLCKKLFLGSMLIGLCTLILFCVVCSFGSTEHVNAGVNRFPNNIRTNMKVVRQYLNNTDKEVDVLLNKNYKSFSSKLLKTLSDGTNIAMERLEEFSNATAMTHLANMVDHLPEVQNNTIQIKTYSRELKLYASQLNDAMRQLKKDLLTTLKDCVSRNVRECSSLNENINKLQTNIDFNKYIDQYFPRLPDITETAAKLNEIDIVAMRKATQDGKRQLEDVRKKIYETTTASFQEAKKRIKETDKDVKEKTDQIKKTIRNVDSQLTKHVEPALEQADHYIQKYFKYGYYVGIAISSVLLLIAIFITLGLICGICGKRPDGYSDNCCNKGAGSKFLICAVAIMFLFGAIIVVVTVTVLLAGITSQRLVCDQLQGSEDSKVIAFLDKSLDLKRQTGQDVTLNQVIRNCRNNASIYNVLNLKDTFVVDDLRKINITEALNGLDLSKVDISSIQILSRENNKKLEELTTIDVDIPIENFKDELSGSFLTVNLSTIRSELDSVIDRLQDSDEYDSLVIRLKNTRLQVDSYNQQLIQPMQEKAQTVLNLASSIDKQLKFNSSSFKEAMSSLLNEVNEAQNLLRKEGTRFLNKTTEEFKESVIYQVNRFLNFTIEQATNDLGKCGPLVLALNGTLISTCDKILIPLNGFWFTLFWALVLFVPTIIVAVKLANVYQKYKPRSSNYYETRGGKYSKKKNKKHKRHEDRAAHNIAGDMVTREYAGASHHSDARYADMAPKHWEDFPANGPPQYQRAPTEYERPPPYYYPGTGDQ